jgi:hypothetical protein
MPNLIAAVALVVRDYDEAIHFFTQVLRFGDALAAGDIALAGKILWLTLKMEWQRGVGFLQSKWLDFKGFFIGIFQSAVYSVAGLMTDAWAGLQTGWLSVISKISSSTI